MRATAAFAATTAVVLAVTGVVVAADGPATTFPPAGRHSTTIEAAGAGLASFDACDAMTVELVARASERGLNALWQGKWFGGAAVDIAAGGMEGGTTGQADGRSAVPAPALVSGEAVDASGTNVQVKGVDEPDVVETDGRRLFMATEGRLHVVDVSRGAPQSLASVEIAVPGEPQLLLDGDRLLVVGNTWGGQIVPMLREDAGMPEFQTPVTKFALYDVATDTPALLAELEVDGNLVSARGIDGTVHAVVAHRPTPVMPTALDGFSRPDGTFDEEGALRQIRSELASTTASDWLPQLAHIDGRGVIERRAAVDCTGVRATSETPDTSMLTVLTFDVTGADLEPEGSTAVLTDATTITASADELVVATPVVSTGDAPTEEPAASEAIVAPDFMPQQYNTRLHLFSLAPNGATYVASGEVPGNVLNQFSMDLWGGSLRVATTTEDWNAGTSESQVVVLQRRADRLETVGSVGGLGKGERIYSVRFVGDRGYVVTFRQIDPLYTLDLTDPAAPTVQGELKITGYSAYLHPLAEHRIIGVGQEATSQGQRVGLQVSLFDTSDPGNPQRLSQVVLPQADTEAEWDHHAILVHGDTMAMPYMRWMAPTAERPEGVESGALVLDVQQDLIALRGTVTAEPGDAERADPWLAQIRRSVYVDGTLYLVGYNSVTAVDAHTLATLGSVTF